jgi:hypothetical protein
VGHDDDDDDDDDNDGDDDDGASYRTSGSNEVDDW